VGDGKPISFVFFPLLTATVTGCVLPQRELESCRSVSFLAYVR